MIIPIQCYSCGEIVADKWDKYIKLIQEEYNKQDSNLSLHHVIIKRDIKETPEKKALDKLKVDRLCCRRMLLGNVDLTEIL